MHLKSLVLKGFKSFADRSVLSLEPGITAIVGPNGSGKSNISDAVLWVLGERNARNLRGQAMEDIVFSGSAARKAVSVAEVDLVLDNSDGTLPVDFDEVVITRRMYRSGESEYLVNGVVARRLDVLDILHDTGLGTGTHSIISQGSLDSILQSKPEDRRALIEEAAGVLKHKQRKEKSARKLAAMDGHLDRVRDVAGEVARQLGPLERKAKRAEAYRKAHSELVELKLALAVDDLRKLQGEWDRACEAEAAVATEVEARRGEVAAAEQKVSDLQELIRRESEDAGELARRHRRAANLAERLDSAEMLMRERRRAAVGYEADARLAIDAAVAKRAEALRELSAAEAQLAEVSESCAAADARVSELGEQRAALETSRREAEESIEEALAALRVCDHDIEEAKREQSFLQESLSSGLAHVKVVEARRAELGAELERARTEHGRAVEAARAAKESVDDLCQREEGAKADTVSRFEARESARAVHDQAMQAVRLVESEISALEQAQRLSREDDPALMWLIDNRERFSGIPVAQVVKAREPGLEALVERLLGEDLSALAVGDAENAASVVEALTGQGVVGDASVIMDDGPCTRRTARAALSPAGHPLIDDLSFPESSRGVIESLLGDVVICDSAAAAFAAHAEDTLGLRFASPDECAIWPSGKVRVFGAEASGHEGVLARERRLEEARAKLLSVKNDLDSRAKASAAADEAYREAQALSLKLSQELANAKGASASAADDEDRAARRLTAITREMEDIEGQGETARATVDELRPGIDECAERLAALESSREQLIANREEKMALVTPLREQAAAVSEKLTEAKLEAATLSERRTYSDRICIARRRDIESLEAEAAETRRSMAVKSASVGRADSVLAAFALVAESLQRRARLLDDAVSASESATGNVHADAAAARDAARRAHDDYDVAADRMAQVRVEKSRLEVQVETAVNAVVVEMSTPLDRAQELPVLDDRQAVEDDVFRLERRIRSMGAINPDAAEEYAQLKERYDYLAGQLADMEAARKSLTRIVKVIDERMKGDFARTFEEVNRNFDEIFGILFPGGSAHLSLEDPDDAENSGVEVTAQPRGKRITKMMLMSGGEKSLTALALLFAVYKTRATPFYILDEVEAALDDTNLRRLISYIDTLRASTQLIMITHQRRTMEMADVLFGVSMQADGVTKVISQKLERALEQAE